MQKNQDMKKIKSHKSFDKTQLLKYIPIIFFIFWFLLFLALSIFRDSRLDENIYLGETTVISDLLQDGTWIGNYGVGLHGFFTKLIVGVIFIFTNPSIFVATLFNILLGIGSGVIFYKILKINFKLSLIYSLLGVTLLFCNFQLFTYIPTYYRDIGALFFVLLIIESVLSNRNKWLVGVYLLLLLDAKEHVFFTLLPAILLWVVLKTYLSHKNQWKVILKEILFDCLKYLLPSILFLLLMFTTSVIPLNMYDAKILGLIRGGLGRMLSDFEMDAATYNRDILANPDTAKIAPAIELKGEFPGFIQTVITFANVILSYLGKIFYPRTFSFLSIPFIILIPSVSMMFKLLKEWIKGKEFNKLLLSISVIIYLMIYIFHASIGRYLIPILPIIIIFFIFFLRDSKKNRFYFKTLLVTLIFAVIGLVFEYSYVWLKVCFVFLILLLFFLMFWKKSFNRLRFKIFLVCLLSIFTVGTSVLASYKNGQIGVYLKYGYSRECEEILSFVESDEKIWINDIGWDRLPFVLREDKVQNPEWRWKLKEWVPKKKLLKKETEFVTYNFYWKNVDEFRLRLVEEDVRKVVFIKLNDNVNERFLLQDRLDILLNSKWLELEKSVTMKNKVVYYFNLRND